jgi:hypothetical protein
MTAARYDRVLASTMRLSESPTLSITDRNADHYRQSNHV